VARVQLPPGSATRSPDGRVGYGAAAPASLATRSYGDGSKRATPVAHGSRDGAVAAAVRMVSSGILMPFSVPRNERHRLAQPMREKDG
jgi:hypothetical protein